MTHIVNKPHGLYYNGELIGIITNPDPFGRLSELCDALSPDEGLASVLPLERGIVGLRLALDCLPETIPVQTERFEPVTKPRRHKLSSHPDDDSYDDDNNNQFNFRHDAY